MGNLEPLFGGVWWIPTRRTGDEVLTERSRPWPDGRRPALLLQDRGTLGRGHGHGHVAYAVAADNRASSTDKRGNPDSLTADDA